jgi:hypothetical protein
MWFCLDNTLVSQATFPIEKLTVHNLVKPVAYPEILFRE